MNKEQKQIIKAFEAAPRTDWGTLYDKIRDSDTHSMLSRTECDIDHMAQFYAELQDYIRCRLRGTGHETALKEAQKTRKKVRKALGYTYP
jgi:hypothetical protein